MHASTHQPEGQARAAAGRRIVPVDAARGLMMLFSCLAHFAWWTHSRYPETGDTLNAIGMIATPTFLLLSGAMAGLLCASAPPGAGRLKEQFVNRGLFLFTVGHLLIALSEAHIKGGLWRAISSSSVVDEIALCTLAVAFLTRPLAIEENCRKIAIAAACVFLSGWALVLFWHPENAALVAAKGALVGGDIGGSRVRFYNSPTLQYVAIYFMGLPLGHLFAGYARGTAVPTLVQRRTLQFGLAAVACAVALRISKSILDMTGIDLGFAENTLRATAKLPPSPTYLLFYAGTGVVLISVLFRIWQHAREPLGQVLEWLAVIGRASLFVFVLQYFLFWTLPDLVGLVPNEYYMLVFIGNVLLLRLAAGFWVSVRGNRFMTFGIRMASA